MRFLNKNPKDLRSRLNVYGTNSYPQDGTKVAEICTDISWGAEGQELLFFLGALLPLP